MAEPTWMQGRLGKETVAPALAKIDAGVGEFAKDPLGNMTGTAAPPADPAEAQISTNIRTSILNSPKMNTTLKAMSSVASTVGGAFKSASGPELLRKLANAASGNPIQKGWDPLGAAWKGITTAADIVTTPAKWMYDAGAAALGKATNAVGAIGMDEKEVAKGFADQLTPNTPFMKSLADPLAKGLSDGAQQGAIAGAKATGFSAPAMLLAAGDPSAQGGVSAASFDAARAMRQHAQGQTPTM